MSSSKEVHGTTCSVCSRNSRLRVFLVLTLKAQCGLFQADGRGGYAEFLSLSLSVTGDTASLVRGRQGGVIRLRAFAPI